MCIDFRYLDKTGTGSVNLKKLWKDVGLEEPSYALTSKWMLDNDGERFDYVKFLEDYENLAGPSAKKVIK